MNKILKVAALATLIALPVFALAAPAAAAAPAVGGPSLPLLVGAGGGGANFSVPIQTLLFFTALSFQPTAPAPTQPNRPASWLLVSLGVLAVLLLAAGAAVLATRRASRRARLGQPA